MTTPRNKRKGKHSVLPSKPPSSTKDEGYFQEAFPAEKNKKDNLTGTEPRKINKIENTNVDVKQESVETKIDLSPRSSNNDLSGDEEYRHEIINGNDIPEKSDLKKSPSLESDFEIKDQNNNSSKHETKLPKLKIPLGSLSDRSNVKKKTSEVLELDELPDIKTDRPNALVSSRYGSEKSVLRNSKFERKPLISSRYGSEKSVLKHSAYDKENRNDKNKVFVKKKETVNDSNVSTKHKHGSTQFPSRQNLTEKASTNTKDGANSSDSAESTMVDPNKYEEYPILRFIQDNVIGKDLIINTPFGFRKEVYCDYTASGRSLTFIEDYIRAQVVPTYANTHSNTGYNARQTSKFREEARAIIKQCVNGSKDDAVVFTGSGATSAVHKVAFALKLNNPRIAEETVVFIGPYEHHSNILPWREYGTKVVRIRHIPTTGLVDLEQLQIELKFWKDKRRQMLVCMSAASNVTGIITDTNTVSSIAHRYGALVIFDYAAGGPYLKIDMNPSKTAYKDVVIISPHKFVGGPGTPGLLIAKKWVFKNATPDRVGGGTVRYVTRERHAYVGNIEEREEGGTPAIIESIRAGMVFQLKRDIGESVIEAREEDLCWRAFEVLERNPCIYILGSHTAKRVPIFAFLVKHQETGKLVHHNFISTLLSDLFGIQGRGGCACAGPYAEDLMGMSENVAKKYIWFLSNKPGGMDNSCPEVPMEIMRPGFTRVNFAYFYDDETIDFIIKAIDMIAKHGWKLLPKYTFNMETATWQHKDFSNTEDSALLSLHDIRFDPRSSELSMPSTRRNGGHAPSYKDVLKAAEDLFTEAERSVSVSRISSATVLFQDLMPQNKRGMKWFLTPTEASNFLSDHDQTLANSKQYRTPFKLIPIVNRTVFDDDSDYHSDLAT